MSIAKVIEITAQSSKSMEDAIEKGVAKAHQTVDNVRNAWVKDTEVLVEGGKVSAYRVALKVTFQLN